MDDDKWLFAKCIGVVLVWLAFIGWLSYASASSRPLKEPEPLAQCHCVTIECQVCPDPDTTVDLRWCEARQYAYNWNGKEWAL
jgi:hypothetical protein